MRVYPAIKRALRQATIDNDATPVFCGSALRNRGVQPVIDAVIDYLPSPLDVPPVKGVKPGTGEEISRETDDEAPLSALVFKIEGDQ